MVSHGEIHIFSGKQSSNFFSLPVHFPNSCQLLKILLYLFHFVSTCRLKTFPILVLRCIHILGASIPVIPSVAMWAFRFAEACAFRDDPSMTQVESEKEEGTKHDWILNTLLGEFDFCIYLGSLAIF